MTSHPFFKTSNAIKKQIFNWKTNSDVFILYSWNICLGSFIISMSCLCIKDLLRGSVMVKMNWKHPKWWRFSSFVFSFWLRSMKQAWECVQTKKSPSTRPYMVSVWFRSLSSFKSVWVMFHGGRHSTLLLLQMKLWGEGPRRGEVDQEHSQHFLSADK